MLLQDNMHPQKEFGESLTGHCCTTSSVKSTEHNIFHTNT